MFRWLAAVTLLSSTATGWAQSLPEPLDANVAEERWPQLTRAELVRVVEQAAAQQHWLSRIRGTFRAACEPLAAVECIAIVDPLLAAALAAGPLTGNVEWLRDAGSGFERVDVRFDPAPRTNPTPFLDATYIAHDGRLVQWMVRSDQVLVLPDHEVPLVWPAPRSLLLPPVWPDLKLLLTEEKGVAGFIDTDRRVVVRQAAQQTRGVYGVDIELDPNWGYAPTRWTCPTDFTGSFSCIEYERDGLGRVRPTRVTFCTHSLPNERAPMICWSLTAEPNTIREPLDWELDVAKHRMKRGMLVTDYTVSQLDGEPGVFEVDSRGTLQPAGTGLSTVTVPRSWLRWPYLLGALVALLAMFAVVRAITRTGTVRS